MPDSTFGLKSYSPGVSQRPARLYGELHALLIYIINALPPRNIIVQSTCTLNAELTRTGKEPHSQWDVPTGEYPWPKVTWETANVQPGTKQPPWRKPMAKGRVLTLGGPLAGNGTNPNCPAGGRPQTPLRAEREWDGPQAPLSPGVASVFVRAIFSAHGCPANGPGQGPFLMLHTERPSCADPF